MTLGGGSDEARHAAATSASGPGSGSAPTFEPGLAGLIPELRWRGMFHDASDGLEARFASNRPITAYIGFDPTGPWLHIGHLVPIFGLIQLQRRGGRPIALMGGGTGMVGDPSGRSAERNLQSFDAIEANVASMRPQLERMLDFDGPNGAIMANNAHWLEPVKLLDFLRDVGKHFTIPYMLSKDSVQTRLAGGLSFTEFSYMLVQSYDYAHLFRTLDCELQMGGADQWGNITAGLELIRRTTPPRDDGAPLAYALAYPLLLAPSGAKFGKSEGGDSVWLHPEGTTPYAFYQHWLNTDDRDVSTYLRWFTTFPPEQIMALDAAVASAPERREAQRTLAFDITARVHGEDVARQVERDAATFYGVGGAIGEIEDAATRERLFKTVAGSFTVDAALAGAPIVVVLAEKGVLPSRSEGRRLIQGGGLTINGQRITDPAAVMPAPVDDVWWDVRIGKKRRVLARRATG